MEVRLLDRDLYCGDPHPAFAWMRAHRPVYQDATGMWAITRHADVVEAERRPHLFSNAHGSRCGRIPQPSMIDADDPTHADQRRIVAKGFGPRQMQRYEEHIRAVVTELLDAVADQPGFDVVGALAAPLPMTLIGEMLGASPADYRRLQGWSDVMIGAADDAAYVTDAVFEAAVAWYEYAAAAHAARLASPTGDLVDLLSHSGLDFDHVQGNALLLLVGGNETTRNVIAGGLHALLTYRDQWDALVADPALVPSAVEECLRWVSPILNMHRVTTEAVTVRGVTIPADSDVLLCYFSANRDEDVFADPFRFDISRDNRHHVAFGFGPHFCLGASLARLEIRIALEETVRRFPGLRLADPGFVPTYSHSTFVRGMAALPVVTA